MGETASCYGPNDLIHTIPLFLLLLLLFFIPPSVIKPLAQDREYAPDLVLTRYPWLFFSFLSFFLSGDIN